MISQTTLDDINNLDIKTVIGKYMTLKPSTGGNWKGLCPFHNDSNASFSVNIPKQIAKCFVCGDKAYKNISFVMAKKNISFNDAVHEIAADNNILVKYDKTEKVNQKDETESIKREPPRKELLDLLADAQAKFITNLQNSKPAIDYLATRNFKETTLKHFEVGFATGYDFARGDDKKLADLEAIFLVKKNEEGKYRDIYFNRITIPFHNQYGKVIGFQGRVIEKAEPKYINPANNDFYKKSEFVYNYHRVLANKPDEIWVVESVMNVFRLFELGIKNVVATCGTAITAEQINKITRISKNVILCYDNDSHKSNAGAKATAKAIELLLPLNANIKIYEIPTAGEDIDSYGYQLQKYARHLILGSEIYNNKPYVTVNHSIKNPLFLQRLFKDNVLNEMLLTNKAKLQKDSEEFGKKNTNLELYLLKVKSLVYDNLLSWLEYLTKDYTKSADVEIEANFIKKLLDKIMLVPDTTKQDLYIESLEAKIKNLKKAFKDRKKAGNKTDEEKEGEQVKIFETSEGTEIINSRGFLVSIGDFKIRLLYQLKIKEKNDCKWIVELQRTDETPHFVEIMNKDLHSTRALREIFYRERFPIDLDDKQLNYLLQHLQTKDVKYAEEVHVIGWHAESELFFFANAAYDYKTDSILLPNHLQIVEKGDKGYFMPFADVEQNQGRNQINFQYSRGTATMRQIADFMAESWDEQTYIALSFYVATLFVDFVSKINPIENFFPIAYAKGLKGSGKSTIANILANFFGNGITGIAFGSTTEVAIPKALANYSNICTHLEDYGTKKEGLEDLTGMLADFWGRKGRTKTDRNNIDDVETQPIKGTGFVTSNILPVDPSERFQSRIIFLLFNKNERTNEQTIKYTNKLGELMANSCTHITTGIIRHRDIVKEKFNDAYKEIVSIIKKSTMDMSIVDRVVNDYAQILAVPYVLIREGLLDFGIDANKLIAIGIKVLKAQQSNISEQSSLSIFWSIIQDGYSKYEKEGKYSIGLAANNSDAVEREVKYNPNYIMPEVHFKICDAHRITIGGIEKVIIHQPVLKIRIGLMFDFYVKQCRSRNISPLSFNEIKELLKEHSSYVKTEIESSTGKKREASYIPSLKMQNTEANENENISKTSVTSGYALIYEHLQNSFGLNLE